MERLRAPSKPNEYVTVGPAGKTGQTRDEIFYDADHQYCYLQPKI